MSDVRKEIDVRPQARLSLQRSFRFCLKGISFRLFRSALTLAVVVVAVAFFMVLLSESVIVRAVSRGIGGQVTQMREADVLLTHLFEPRSSRELSMKLSQIDGQLEGATEFATVAGLSDEAAATLMRQARLEQRYTAFFQGLSVGKRMVLVKKHEWREVFDFLHDETVWQSFTDALADMRSVRLPTDLPTLRAFVEGHATYVEQMEAARLAWAQTRETMMAELAVLTGGVPSANWLPTASAAELEMWRGIVTGHGFGLDQATAGRLQAQVTVSQREAMISRTLRSREKRQAWKETFKASPGIEEKMMQLTDPRVSALLDEAFTAEELAEVVARYTKSKQLRALQLKLPPQRAHDQEDRFLSGQQMFLVVISFLVCMVGIANAMLMAITERFREIATMKCLGATDGFILKQFLIEAAIQGLIGGAAGTLIGLVISLTKSTLILGGSVFTFLPTVPLLLCALFTLCVGVVLAMLASVYPSKAAARMAPMDAMRVE